MLWRRRKERGPPAGEADWLIVGLGNPGSHFAGNRHNVGFWTVNRLGRSHGIDVKARGKLTSLGEGAIDGVAVALAKPRTYVNRSGEAVAELLRRYRITPQRLVVAYDDLDLPTGRVRLRGAGGHGGYGGMKSIVGAVGKDFPRVRIGIGRPVVDGEPSWDPDIVADYVLSDPPAEERARLDDAVAIAAEAIEAIVREGIDAAMNRYNRRD